MRNEIKKKQKEDSVKRRLIKWENKGRNRKGEREERGDTDG